MIWQQLFNGVFVGSVYALFALGYTLVFGVLGVLNLAHGAIFMTGAFASWYLVLRAGTPLWLAMLIATVGAGLLGLVTDRIGFEPLRRRRADHMAPMISSIAIATILQSIALAVFGPDLQRFPREVVESSPLVMATIQTTHLELAVIAVTLALLVGLNYLVGRTKLGKAIRAVAEDAHVAAFLGVNVNRVIRQTFFISSALGGAAGVLVGLLYNSINPYMFGPIELRGLAIITVGGMGSIPGAMVGGLILGISEVLSTVFVSSFFRDAVAFALLFLVLILRPSGLLGQKSMRAG